MLTNVTGTLNQTLIALCQRISEAKRWLCFHYISAKMYMS